MELKPKGRLAEPPEWLSESQKEIWREAISSSPLGLLRRIDSSALLVWTIACDLQRQALKEQANLGLVVKAPQTGQPIQSPYLAIINRQGVIMLKAASELGFTPASRPRTQALHFPGGPEEGGDATADSLDDYLASDPRLTRQ